MNNLNAITPWLGALILMVTGCTRDTQETDRQRLDEQKARIVAYTKSTPCGRGDECRVAGVGAKPCGGPWDYVVYSSLLDTVRLFRMLNEYHQQEEAFNRKWGIVSDCAIAVPPDSVKCEGGVCVGYWNGYPR